MRRATKLLGIGGGIAVAVVAALFFANLLPIASADRSSGHLAPDFTLPTIYGRNFTLDQYRNQSVVVLEFTSLSCSECQIVEQSLASLYTNYNRSGTTSVQILSIYIEPQFGDTIPALRSYHDQHNISWFMAQDTDQLTVYNAYGVSDIPTVVIVDKQGAPTYRVAGAQSTQQLATNIAQAQAGTAAPISLVTLSVFALAAVAGISTFFSPCAFPMFPGYMSLFLGLNTAAASSSDAPKAAYRGAVRRALSAGSIAATGMMIVFLLIGLGLLYAARAVSGYIPFFMVIIGAILIGMGALLLTNLQYWRIITPFQRLWGRLTGRETGATVVAGPTAEGRGLHLKLFSYGMGYAAAAAGCVAPVILSAIVAGLALGLVDGIVNMVIYSLTAALLMIAVTVLLAVAGQRYVNQLKAYTPLIKKVSAAALLIVGVYLLYFYYTAWGFSAFGL